MNKADVYRKAAEILIRDGQVKGRLVDTPFRADEDTNIEAIKNTRLSVCAMGACARAEYELYGTVPMTDDGLMLNPYTPYSFNAGQKGGIQLRIYTVNDQEGTSAEDIALLFKHRAAEIDGEEVLPSTSIERS